VRSRLISARWQSGFRHANEDRLSTGYRRLLMLRRRRHCHMHLRQMKQRADDRQYVLLL